MNTVLKKGNIIAKIRKGEDLEQIIDYVKSEIYQNGPNSSVVLEIVSYFKLFQPEFFKKDEQEIIATMGLFFKQPKIESLTGSVFEMYHQQLKDEFGNDYTPMQADILKKIRDLLNTPPETVRVGRTNGAAKPLKWCKVTAAMVH